MHYQKVLKMLESIPYLSVGLDVGADNMDVHLAP